MSNGNKVRLAHELLDEVKARQDLTPEQTEVLRSFLPERPKEKTLKALRHDVYDVWAGVIDNEWPEDMYCSLENWLHELHVQLLRLDSDKPAPGLPAGMRLADHEQYGRVVTSPKPDKDGVYVLLISKPKVETVADLGYAHECELTFIDHDPAKPTHPEVLITGADYEEAPWGTVVAIENADTAWIKKGDSWSNTDGERRTDSQILWGVPREVLRWGSEGK